MKLQLPESLWCIQLAKVLCVSHFSCDLLMLWNLVVLFMFAFKSWGSMHTLRSPFFFLTQTIEFTQSVGSSIFLITPRDIILSSYFLVSLSVAQKPFLERELQGEHLLWVEFCKWMVELPVLWKHNQICEQCHLQCPVLLLLHHGYWCSTFFSPVLIDPSLSPALLSYCCYACQAFVPGTSITVCMHRCQTFPRK